MQVNPWKSYLLRKISSIGLKLEINFLQATPSNFSFCSSLFSFSWKYYRLMSFQAVTHMNESHYWPSFSPKNAIKMPKTIFFYHKLVSSSRNLSISLFFDFDICYTHISAKTRIFIRKTNKKDNGCLSFSIILIELSTFTKFLMMKNISVFCGPY